MSDLLYRELYGSDENLDDNHLMRMAGDAHGRAIQPPPAWLGQSQRCPGGYCSPDDDKHKMAEQYQSAHKMKPRLFLVLVAKAPVLVWEARKTGAGELKTLESGLPNRRIASRP